MLASRCSTNEHLQECQGQAWRPHQQLVTCKGQQFNSCFTSLLAVIAPGSEFFLFLEVKERFAVGLEDGDLALKRLCAAFIESLLVSWAVHSRDGVAGFMLCGQCMSCCLWEEILARRTDHLDALARDGVCCVHVL